MAQQPPRPVKFNFDNVFGPKGETKQAAPRARSSYSSDEVEAIRKETFQKGKTDTEAMAAAVKAQALGALAQSMTTIIAQFDAAVLAMRQESAMVALQVGRKLAEVALTHFPQPEVEAVVAECLHKLHREPRLVVRVSPACADALRADIEAMCKQQGYAGRVIIMGEPSLSAANCSIEWADGGIERDMAATFATIEQSAERWRASTSSEEN